MADNAEEPLFQVVESDDFLVRVARVFESIQRWDEVKWSFGWLLELAPGLGQYLPTYDTWVLKLRTAPAIAVYYTIDDTQHLVTLLDLMVLES